MQITVKPEHVQEVCEALKKMGAPVSVKRNGTGPGVINAPAEMSWKTITAVRNMPGVVRVAKGSRRIDDANIAEFSPLDSPQSYRKEFPAGPDVQRTTRSSREEIRAVLKGEDSRFMLLVGPCSIHDTVGGLEYALKLAKLAREVRDRIYLVMRVYFEKPRTTVGWEGLIQDPHLDGSFDMNVGFARARQFLLRILKLGLPTATEFVDPFTPQYISDLVSCGFIGARSAEAQAYRRMASGLSMPVGIKNGTGGSVQLAVNGVVSASAPHPFLGIDMAAGRIAQIRTLGNPDCFIVLRGGSSGPNYDSQSVGKAVVLLEKAGVCPNLMVDCSHDNSRKDLARQRTAFECVVGQRAAGNPHIVGAMMESYLEEGNQELKNPQSLRHGVSVTDPCIGWAETESLTRAAYEKLAP